MEMVDSVDDLRSSCSVRFFVNSCSGSSRSSSFVPPLLSDSGVSTSLLSDTGCLFADVDSCDEDDEEADEGVVGEELADIPGTTNVSLTICILAPESTTNSLSSGSLTEV